MHLFSSHGGIKDGENEGREPSILSFDREGRRTRALKKQRPQSWRGTTTLIFLFSFSSVSVTEYSRHLRTLTKTQQV
jgi:hypothetical protein